MTITDLSITKVKRSWSRPAEYVSAAAKGWVHICALGGWRYVGLYVNGEHVASFGKGKPMYVLACWVGPEDKGGMNEGA